MTGERTDGNERGTPMPAWRRPLSWRPLLAILLLTAPVPALAQIDDPADDSGGWKGRIGLGATINTGTQESTLGDVDADAKGRFGRWKHEFGVHGSFGRTEGVTTDRRFGGNARTGYDIDDGIYVFGLFEYENDRFAGYTETVSEAVGLGYAVFDTETFDLDVEAGPTFRQARRRVDGEVESEIMLRLGSKLAWRMSPTAKLTNATTLLLTDNRVEVGTNAGFESQWLQTRNLTELTVPIVDALSGRVALELRYTSDPPPEASALDTRTRVGVVYAF